MQKDFKECLNNKVGFKGFGLSEEKQKSESVMDFEGQSFTLKHGKLVDKIVKIHLYSWIKLRNVKKRLFEKGIMFPGSMLNYQNHE